MKPTNLKTGKKTQKNDLLTTEHSFFPTETNEKTPAGLTASSPQRLRGQRPAPAQNDRLCRMCHLSCLASVQTNLWSIYFEFTNIILNIELCESLYFQKASASDRFFLDFFHFTFKKIFFFYTKQNILSIEGNARWPSLDRRVGASWLHPNVRWPLSGKDLRLLMDVFNVSKCLFNVFKWVF